MVVQPREPLSETALRTAIRSKTGFWQRIGVVNVTNSTQDDLLREAASGAPAPRVLLTELQLAGRGRRGRTWTAPARSSLMMSLLVRPKAAPEHWSLLTPLTALALAETLEGVGLSPAVKWPNDVLLDGRKTAGILAAADGGAAVIGMGVNVSTTREELPLPEATSLAVAGADPLDRNALASEFLTRFASLYTAWESDPASVLGPVRQRSATLGREVRVELPGGEALVGTAVDLTGDGGLVVASEGERRTVTAAETVHLRPA
ncbi:biotin--[acetyl-CoA-carboxylase] ligase [Salininema proteolyticum]|uniref:biotin--[biotin carboxyl-carrier protein] ligase n=1 Tax=Salininema proteolyticum TaxID=1607685 RepID=A0ABV8TSL5_9ACTN